MKKESRLLSNEVTYDHETKTLKSVFTETVARKCSVKNVFLKTSYKFKKTFFTKHLWWLLLSLDVMATQRFSLMFRYFTIFPSKSSK